MPARASATALGASLGVDVVGALAAGAVVPGVLDGALGAVDGGFVGVGAVGRATVDDAGAAFLGAGATATFDERCCPGAGCAFVRGGALFVAGAVERVDVCGAAVCGVAAGGVTAGFGAGGGADGVAGLPDVDGVEGDGAAVTAVDVSAEGGLAAPLPSDVADERVLSHHPPTTSSAPAASAGPR
jgi:hypothetical protein